MANAGGRGPRVVWGAAKGHCLVRCDARLGAGSWYVIRTGPDAAEQIDSRWRGQPLGLAAGGSSCCGQSQVGMSPNDPFLAIDVSHGWCGTPASPGTWVHSALAGWQQAAA